MPSFLWISLGKRDMKWQLKGSWPHVSPGIFCIWKLLHRTICICTSWVFHVCPLRSDSVSNATSVWNWHRKWSSFQSAFHKYNNEQRRAISGDMPGQQVCWTPFCTLDKTNCHVSIVRVFPDPERSKYNVNSIYGTLAKTCCAEIWLSELLKKFFNLFFHLVPLHLLGIFYL